MKNIILTTGYLARHTTDSKTSKVQTFKQLVEVVNGIVVDIRMSPHSIAPCWRKHNLQSLLGDRYVHVPDLGNVNYRGDGPITIHRLEPGLALVLDILAQDNRVPILMCGCESYDHCHRKVVAEALREYAMQKPMMLTVVEIDCWQDNLAEIREDGLENAIIKSFDSEMLRTIMAKEFAEADAA